MDIKIGFIDTGRELVIAGVASVSGASVSHQSEAVALINGAMDNGAAVIEFADSKGRRYLVRAQHIAFVEVGTNEPRTVGFAG